jgi:hypothetical protein
MSRLVLVAIVASLLAVHVAEAHDRKEVGGFRLVIGWGDEPAFSGLKNGVEVDVADMASKPVTEDATLAVDVSFGSEKVTLPLRAVRAQPGKYRAVLLPTRAGTYMFHITGMVKGQAIDATSRCGEGTFACVMDVSAIQFPMKDPSAGELAERMTRELTRAGAATETAGTARALSIAALGLAVVGVVAAVGFRRRHGTTRG